MKKIVFLMFLLSILCFGNSSSLFFKAIKNKNYNEVESIINKGYDIELKNSNNESALTLAIQNNDIKMIELLIKNGININPEKEGKWDCSYLAQALVTESREISKILIEYGADVNDEFVVPMVGYYQYLTPLIWVCSKNDLELCKLIINSGAEVNKVMEGEFALDVAIQTNSVQCAELLIEKGADIYHKSTLGESLIISTFVNDSIGCFKLLEEAGISLNDKYKFLSRPSESLLNLALQNNAKKISNFLIEREIGLNEKNSYGEIPINLAIYNYNLKAVELLLEKGINIDSVNNEGYSPLMIAIIMDNTIMVQFLLEKGANVKLRTNDGKSLLQLATSPKMRKFLIAKGVK